MAVWLHKWEFKNTDVDFLKVGEKIWLPGLPDIGARKSCDFRILTVSASTGYAGYPLQSQMKRRNADMYSIDFFHAQTGNGAKHVL